MNTNDFYKELMSEYSFDYEKIRKAAMGKSVQAKKSRLKTVWLSVAGAAAAVAITFSSVYVTFRNSVTPEEMQSILAKADSKGNIRVTEVYLSDNTKVKGSEAFAALFEENAKDITAVKVYCPGNFLIKLTALDGVYLVETEDSFSKDDFSAIDTSSEYDYYPDYSTTEPVTPPDAVPGDTTNVAE